LFELQHNSSDCIRQVRLKIKDGMLNSAC